MHLSCEWEVLHAVLCYNHMAYSGADTTHMCVLYDRYADQVLASIRELKGFYTKYGQVKLTQYLNQRIHQKCWPELLATPRCPALLCVGAKRMIVRADCVAAVNVYICRC
jgi:hypothetical protein